MSQESDIREEIASIGKDIQIETMDLKKWEREAQDELYKILQDPTISQDDKAKASRDFHQERIDKYQNSIEPLMRQIDELSNKLNALLAAQNAPKSNGDAKAGDKNLSITSSDAGKYGARGNRGEKGKSYSNGFLGSTKGLSGKSGGNGKKAK